MASWEEYARNFLLEEEEEDEELFFVLLPALVPFLDEEETPEHIFADWVQYKKKQINTILEELSKKKRQDEEFSVDKCLDEVDAMEGLTDVEKAYAMSIFKSKIDREVFMKMKNKNVRLIWLKQEISDTISRCNVGGGNV